MGFDLGKLITTVTSWFDKRPDNFYDPKTATYWEKKVLTLGIDPSCLSRQAAISEGVHRWDSELKALGIVINIATPQPKDAIEANFDLYVRVGDTNAGGGFNAYTHTDIAPGSFIVTHAVTNLLDSLVKGAKTEYFIEVWSHEFGHQMGIVTHSPFNRDLMYKSASVSFASSADKNTLGIGYVTRK